MTTITQKNVTIITHHYSNGQLHCREFWVEGKLLTEQEVEKLLKPAPSCEGKTVVIDGKECVLMERGKS